MLFLGREREMRQLVGGCDEAIAGKGGLTLVLGEPGIGKTRLADEVATLAAGRGMRVAWGRAWESGGAPPFHPWTEVLEAIGGEPAAAPRLDKRRPPRGESAGADAARERFALFDAVLAFLRERSRSAPLLLVFDDLHAADLPSLELLHFVTRGLRARRIAVLGTARDVEARRPPVAEILARLGREATQVSLGALSAEHVGRLVEEHTGRADPRLTSELVTRTDGNPLFVGEVLRALGDRAVAPSGVLAVIASRTVALDEATSRVLDAAAVSGRRVLASSLAATTGLPLVEVLARLGELVERGVLRPVEGGAFVFPHALVRDAFYERIPEARRRELHRSFATALAAGEPGHAALAAHHALAALPLTSSATAVRAAIVAAEAARARLAPDEAVALLERVAAAVADLSVGETDRIELLLALGWAATEAGALARGRQVFREATRRARAAGDGALLARAALGQGAELVLGEVRDELVATLRGALEIPLVPELRARVLARLAAALQPSTTPEEPVDLARRAMAISDQVTDPRARMEIALAAGAALADFAPPAERVAVSGRLVNVARDVDDAVAELRGLTRLATDWIEIGDFARAEGVVDARAELAARVGHPRYLWQTPLLRSMLAMPRGAFAVCDESLEEAAAIGQDGLDVNASHVIAVHRFWMLLVRADAQGLVEHAPEMMRAMRRMPEPAQHHALVQALVHARSGDPAGARDALVGIGDGARMLAPMMLATIADAALLAGDEARFPALLARLAPARGRYAAWGPFGFTCGPPYDAVLGALAARLGRRDEALASFAAALELTRRSGARACEAWVHLARAEASAWLDEPGAEDFATAARLGRALGMDSVVLRAEEGAARSLAATTRAGDGAARGSRGATDESGDARLDALGGAKPAPAAASERPATSARAAASGPVAAPGDIEFSLRPTDKDVLLVCAGRTTRLRPVRGLTMLERLVEQPGREIHVLDLAADPEDADAVADRGDAGEVLDARARQAYQQRVGHLRAEIDEAERFGDVGRADRARRELDLLLEQLASAVGLGGRARRVGAAAERARITVQRRVREAIRKIAEHEPELGRHLDWAVRTGTFCAYEPMGRKTAR